MSKRLAFVHTVSSLVSNFKTLCDELIPEADVFNIVDESLLQNCIREGGLSPVTARRLLGYVVSAEQAGADLLMVTCSSMGPAVEMARPLVNISVLRVDEPMAQRAVKMGHRIGVAATLRTTLDPTTSLIKSKARAASREVEVIYRLCEGAYEAALAGDRAKHDAIIREGLRELGDQVDVIVLAQASMAQVVNTLPESERHLPVLSSPRLAVEHLARVIKTRARRWHE